MSGVRRHVVLLGLLAGLLAMAAAPIARAQSVPAGEDSLRSAVTRERFYFVMPDRFANGSPANDRGGLSGAREVTGFDPTRKGWYHGGDLPGLISKLDYIKGLGTTAIWLTPSFKNKPVQGLGTPFPSAGYHGYWITDFTQIDPHLGSNADLRALVDGAHARGMKVFFDIITNHTADVIKSADNQYGYVSKAAAPYKDADRHRVRRPRLRGQGHVPDARPDGVVPASAARPGRRGERQVARVAQRRHALPQPRQQRPSPARTRSTATSPASTTSSRRTSRSCAGCRSIYDTWIRGFRIDGFRIDTMKHVNLEFWQQFLPHIEATATAAGRPDFFAFGEVFDSFSNPFLSRFTTAGKRPGGARLPVPAAGARLRLVQAD